MDAGPSLRERKKAATRLALHHAVVELAAAKGLDTVTVDAIADHANVSRRTFSNYFASKEEAFFYAERVRYDRLMAEVRARPAKESPWQALSRSAHVLLDHLREIDPVRLAQLRLVRRHPSLAAFQMSMQSTVERDLADELLPRIEAADELTTLVRARVLAGSFLAALRAAVSIWIDRQDEIQLEDAIDAALRTACERLR
jgi:AcrR family transcriptional regulator